MRFREGKGRVMYDLKVGKYYHVLSCGYGEATCLRQFA